MAAKCLSSQHPILHKSPQGVLHFSECNLSNSDLSGSISISLNYFNLTGAKISRVKVQSARNFYYEAGKPPTIEAFMDEDIELYNAGERYSGPPQYRPTATTPFKTYSTYIEKPGEENDIPF